MPRIRRWFNVSHDIFDDPEVSEIEEEFGDWAFKVWLKILSESDRDGGKFKGSLKYIVKTLSRVSGSSHPQRGVKVEQLLRKMEGKLKWISIRDWGLKVRNYKKYHPKREINKPHVGDK